MSAGNIDSSRIAPRSNDSPILLIPTQQNNIKLLRSHSAYNQPVVFDGDSLPDHNIDVCPFEPNQIYESKDYSYGTVSNQTSHQTNQLSKHALDLLASLGPLLPSDYLTKRKGVSSDNSINRLEGVKTTNRKRNSLLEIPDNKATSNLINSPIKDFHLVFRKAG